MCSSFFSLPCVTCLVVGLSATGLAAPPIGTELIANGDFRTDANNDGWPDGWERRAGVTMKEENGNRWLLFSQYAEVDQTLDIDPDVWALTVRCRMRVTGVKMGKEGWQDARLAMNFTDGTGKHVDPWPSVFHATGTSGWVTHEKEFLVPAGAAKLRMGPAHFGSAGTAEFDDVSVTVHKHRPRKEDLALPEGVDAGWDMTTAWRQTSPTRESVCLNGLWRFFPVTDGEAGATAPADGEGWGWFKVPGVWPRRSEVERGAPQDFLLPDWTVGRLDADRLEQAWYRRTVTIPEAWGGRTVAIDLSMVQTHAAVFVDGNEAGSIFFPGGRVDISNAVTPGKTHDIALLVTARPLSQTETVFMAPDRAFESKATVNVRGLTGDAFLVSEPKQNAIADVHVITSTRAKRIALDLGVRNVTLPTFALHCRILRDNRVVKEFDASEVTVDEGGRLRASAGWDDPELWDLHTPENMYDVVVTLSNANGAVADTSLPTRFGFREFWIDGHDFYLNGKRIHLRALLARNITHPANLACAAMCDRTLERIKEYGFNFFITSNYSFPPGGVSYIDGMLGAADRSGVLNAFSLPHIKDFATKLDEPEQAQRYRDLTQALIRRVQNHPSVVLYCMNHNATGYKGDQNPLRIDGLFDPEDPGNGGRPNRNRQQAGIAASIAKAIDPTRPVYHHQSGNLGDMYTINTYLNWAPIQERSDWLEHWASTGVKPLFFVEWGLPHISSWSSYRGPNFIWRTEAYQSILDAEFAAAIIGERAYQTTDQTLKSLDWEEELWARGKPFAWGWLIQHFRQQEQNNIEIASLFAADNWRAHRTWGASAMLPWDQETLWRRVPGQSTKPADNPAKFADLNRPGIVPDRFSPDGQYIHDGVDTVFEPTSLGKTFLRWNMPLCAYIGGGPDQFTEKGHTFTPGDTIQKQLVVLNDTRETVHCDVAWDLADLAKGTSTVDVLPGGRAFVPVRFGLPETLAAGRYVLSAAFRFPDGSQQRDSFDIDILPPVPGPGLNCAVTVYDPEGDTTTLLTTLGVSFERVDSVSDVSNSGILVIGRNALGVNAPWPTLGGVRDGLKVLIFEQQADALEERLGFRVNVHGMRRVFARSADHPVLQGLTDEHLRDWRGDATLVPPHLEGADLSNPDWLWCGFRNTRVWRCGNTGTVASVLIEKPPVGSFRPIVDCGFDLQYSPLMEYVEGKGRIVFCQLDVSGRTADEPAARKLCVNLLKYLDQATPGAERVLDYAGDARGRDVLSKLGFAVAADTATPESVLVVGPGHKLGDLRPRVEAGLNLLCLGLNQKELDAVLPGVAKTAQGPTPSARVDGLGSGVLDAISNADLHWRTRLDMSALVGEDDGRKGPGLRVMTMVRGTVILCQVAPWMLDTEAKGYLRTSYRRNVYLVSRLLHNLGVRDRCPLLARFSARRLQWRVDLPTKWVGRVDRDDVGRKEKWHASDLDVSSWAPINVPGFFDEQVPGLSDYNGLFWYRLAFPTPQDMSSTRLTLHLGGIDDESWVWLNDRFLGEVTTKTNPKDYWEFPRRFDLKPGELRPDGENVLAIRVNDNYRSGGITGTPRLETSAPWLTSYYVQSPEANDDPYRYYRW